MGEYIRSGIFKINVEVDTNKQTYKKIFVYDISKDDSDNLDKIIKLTDDYFEELLSIN